MTFGVDYEGYQSCDGPSLEAERSKLLDEHAFASVDVRKGNNVHELCDGSDEVVRMQRVAGASFVVRDEFEELRNVGEHCCVRGRRVFVALYVVVNFGKGVGQERSLEVHEVLQCAAHLRRAQVVDCVLCRDSLDQEHVVENHPHD